jgi:molybdopterin biosynthesis enzyme
MAVHIDTGADMPDAIDSVVLVSRTKKHRHCAFGHAKHFQCERFSRYA